MKSYKKVNLSSPSPRYCQVPHRNIVRTPAAILSSPPPRYHQGFIFSCIIFINKKIEKVEKYSFLNTLDIDEREGSWHSTIWLFGWKIVLCNIDFLKMSPATISSYTLPQYQQVPCRNIVKFPAAIPSGFYIFLYNLYVQEN